MTVAINSWVKKTDTLLFISVKVSHIFKLSVVKLRDFASCIFDSFSVTCRSQTWQPNWLYAALSSGVKLSLPVSCQKLPKKTWRGLFELSMVFLTKEKQPYLVTSWRTKNSDLTLGIKSSMVRNGIPGRRQSNHLGLPPLVHKLHRYLSVTKVIYQRLQQTWSITTRLQHQTGSRAVERQVP